MRPFNPVMAGLTLLASQGAAAQDVRVTRADYARAEQFLPWNAVRLVKNMSISPTWIGGTERFWYQRQTNDGHEYVLVDAARAGRGPAFDHAGIAAALSRVTGQSYAAAKLPLTGLAYPAPDTVSFSLGTARWTCHTTGSGCKPSPPLRPPPAANQLPSPDGRWLAYSEANDLFIRSAVDGTVRRLTTDGEPDNGFGIRPDAGQSPVTDRLRGVVRPPPSVWSPDSKRLISHRLDQRGVAEQVLVDASATPLPVIHHYRASNPGDFIVPKGELVIFDIETGRIVPVQLPPLFATYFTAFDFGQIWWSKDGSRVYVIAEERGWKAVRFFEVDARTGVARLLHEESAKTFIELSVDWGGGGLNVRVLDDGNEFIWFSEREGWARLYLHDGSTGRLKNRITEGDWVVRRLERIDEQKRQVYFTAGGREAGRDPYYAHLYRANLDGTGLTLLTPEDAAHSVQMSPSGGYFVDTYSRVDQPPITVLRSAEGKLVTRLEEADPTALMATGWKPPERFTVKARDGTTDLYGALFRPTGFDPNRQYPIVDDYYPGAQTIRTPKSFEAALGGSQATAELGFVVVTLDGMGTALRSKSFHDQSYRNFADASLPDHITGLQQLARRYPYMDIDRVGIHGTSAGGYGSMRAILGYPDFFKVAVSSSGNTTPRSVLTFWIERWFGFPVGDYYDEQDNARLAGNLKGKLLLIWGDMDDTALPYQTQQLVSALIKVNKDFDLLVVPGANHGASATPYAIRRRWDYFVNHLLGAKPPPEYEIKLPGPR